MMGRSVSRPGQITRMQGTGLSEDQYQEASVLC
jgi:hypothetical protein